MGRTDQIPSAQITNLPRDLYGDILYGDIGYTITDDVLSLPERMPGIYRRLTT
jgi:hypothetical protein